MRSKASAASALHIDGLTHKRKKTLWLQIKLHLEKKK